MDVKYYGYEPTETFKNIVAWVTAQFSVTRHKVILRFMPSEKKKVMTEGRTRKLIAAAGGYIGITLNISNDMSYPHVTQYVKGLPPMVVNSFEEELVLVLAHEMRHAVQFSTGMNFFSVRELETDAEISGYAMLEAYRKGKKLIDNRGMRLYPTP